MDLKFNIDRPKVSDEEIKKNQNFNALVEQFKKQSLKKARGDESWRRNKLVRYSAVIAGITVVCTVTYVALQNYQKNKITTHDKISTSSASDQKTRKKTAIASGFISPKYLSSAGPEILSHLKTPYTKYKVNNQKGGVIKHFSGSTIHVPENSFINSSGEQIKGEVNIEYREFHDIGDVIANGVPMSHDSLEKKMHLETAGMFDIRGTHDGQPVLIAQGSLLTVELASRTESRFNQYVLDTIANNWKFLGRDKNLPLLNAKHPPAVNKEQLLVLKREIEKIIPKKIDSVKTTYKASVDNIPAILQPFKPAKQEKGRPSFKLDGSYDEFPELSAFSNVLFEVGPENKNYNKELHDITWSDIRMSPGPAKGKNYFLDMQYRNRHERLIVYPVLSTKDFDKATEEYERRFNEYRVKFEKRNAEERRLLAELEKKQSEYLAEQKRKQAEYDAKRIELTRADNVATRELTASFGSMDERTKARSIFKLSSFGIFNSDCPHPEPSGEDIDPKFVLNNSGQELQAQDVMLIDHESKLVFWLDKHQKFKLRFDPRYSYSLCLFTRDGIFICDKKQFSENVVSGSGIFGFREAKAQTRNLSDFKKALEI
jgi:hypothetical protein